MYAVIDTGGRQLRVEVGDVVHVDRREGEVGGEIVFDRVLMIGGQGDVRIGAPTVEGAHVRASVVSQDRGPKIIIYTYKKRKNAERKHRGHRQELTSVRIEAIES
jgi:large subunit ribosomal protein L21